MRPTRRALLVGLLITVSLGTGLYAYLDFLSPSNLSIQVQNATTHLPIHATVVLNDGTYGVTDSAGFVKFDLGSFKSGFSTVFWINAFGYPSYNSTIQANIPVKVIMAPSLTVGRIVTPGNIGPCSWFVNLDGTTPVAMNMIQATVSGKVYSPGDNYVGSPGQDMGAYLAPLTASNQKYCFSGQTFTFSTKWLLQGLSATTIAGQGNDTVFQMSATFPTSTDFVDFETCSDAEVGYLKLIGVPTLLNGANLKFSQCNGITVDHVVATKAPDDGIYVANSTAGTFTRMILYNNGNTNAPLNVQNNGGIEIDAAFGINTNMVISDSIAYSNYGPGFAVNNADAGGIFNRFITMSNLISINNVNQASGSTFGIGVEAKYDRVTLTNIVTYGNQNVGFLLNGGPGSGPLSISSSVSDDGNPVSFTNACKIPEKVSVNVAGYSPVGRIPGPFYTNGVSGATATGVGVCAGNVSGAISASTDYPVGGTAIFMTCTGGTGVSISVKDKQNNIFAGLTGLATITGQLLPIGYRINYGAFSVAPTCTVEGA